jgi:hypothetical protein
MPYTYITFDFGTNEEAAQQARHRLEGWRQGFRLGNKVQFKFERQDSGDKEPTEKGAKAKSEQGSGGRVRLLIRLDFSNHEKHLFHEWLERIPATEPFKSAKSEVIGQKEARFEETTELFDNLN